MDQTLVSVGPYLGMESPVVNPSLQAAQALGPDPALGHDRTRAGESG